jgi:hypothetical protein
MARNDREFRGRPLPPKEKSSERQRLAQLTLMSRSPALGAGLSTISTDKPFSRPLYKTALPEAMA